MSGQFTAPSKTLNIDGETKTFPDNTKFEQYLSTSQVLHGILEGKLSPNDPNYNQNKITQEIKHRRNKYVPIIKINSIIETYKHTYPPM